MTAAEYLTALTALTADYERAMLAAADAAPRSAERWDANYAASKAENKAQKLRYECRRDLSWQDSQRVIAAARTEGRRLVYAEREPELWSYDV